MALPGSLRTNGLWRAVLGAVIAGLSTCAVTSYGWWSAGGSVPRPEAIEGIVVLLAFGVAAGLVSGRFRDAPVSWAGAVLGAALDYQAFYAMFPGQPIPEDGFHGNLGVLAVFLLPLIAGGHLLGVTVANQALRRARGRG